MLYTVVPAQLQVEGLYNEAETEYLKSIAAWEATGRGDSAEMAATISGLGTLQLAQDRYLDAGKTLERALAIVKFREGCNSDACRQYSLATGLPSRPARELAGGGRENEGRDING